MGHALRKVERLMRLKTYLLSQPEVHWEDIVRFNGVYPTTTHRDLKEIGAFTTRKGYYSLRPAASDIALKNALTRDGQSPAPEQRYPHEYDDPRGAFEHLCWCGRTFRTDDERRKYGGDKCQRAAQNERNYQRRKGAS